MKEVQNKWNTLKLNDDIWAKLIYFEQNRRLAKAYVSAPVLTVDGSTHGLDGFRIGLSGIDNTYRSLDSIGCLRSIGHGIKLKIDHHGNILIRRIGPATGQSSSTPPSSATSIAPAGQCSVWVKDWPVGGKGAGFGAATTENCMMRELEQSDAPYKLFDMRNFRSQLEKRRLNRESTMDWRQCVTVISFVAGKPPTSGGSLLEDPCWVMLINIIAIDMIKSSASFTGDGLDAELAARTKGPSLIQNPALHEARGFNNNNEVTTTTGGGNSQRSGPKSHPKSPYRTSSSSSILFPATAPAISRGNGTTTTQSGNDSTTSHLQLTSERLKKLRTSNSSRNRAAASGFPAATRQGGGGAHHRRYQSIQQLSSSSATASSNSTIYTTFNGKFASKQQQHYGRHQLDNSSSTSDYNTGSRSVASSGQANYWRSAGHYYQQLQHNNNTNNNMNNPYESFEPQYQPLTDYYKQYRPQAGRVQMFSRKSLLPYLDSSNKSLSLSTFDLSHQKRFDPRPVHSSIRMNYDHDQLSAADEPENDDDDDGLEYEENVELDEREDLNLPASSSNPESCMDAQESPGLETADENCCSSPSGKEEKLSSSASSSTTSSTDNIKRRLDPTKILKNQQSSSSKLLPSGGSVELMKSPNLEQVNHNECQATQGRSVELVPVGDDLKPIQNQHNHQHNHHNHHHQQQQQATKAAIFGSSIGSTSSSSGCPDNDYFMSHSSSSMSSSTASNERELFSQPASSSGIICSAGSTSDECDESARGKLSTKSLVVNEKNHHQPGKLTKQVEQKTVALAGSDKELARLQKVNGVFEQTARKNKSKKTIWPPAVKFNNRKAPHKLIENPNYCCDQSQLTMCKNNRATNEFTLIKPDAEDHHNHHLNCKCMSLDYTCCSECCPQSHLIETSLECGCTTSDPYYMDSRLLKSAPRSSSATNLTSTTTDSGRMRKKTDADRATRRAAASNNMRISSLTKIDDAVEDDFEKISTIPMQEPAIESGGRLKIPDAKESQKQTGSWLERRRYTRILPKFMFSSSSSSTTTTTTTSTTTTTNSSNNNNNRPKDNQISNSSSSGGKDKMSKKKAGHNMMRLTRSTQDLV